MKCFAVLWLWLASTAAVPVPVANPGPIFQYGGPGIFTSSFPSWNQPASDGAARRLRKYYSAAIDLGQYGSASLGNSNVVALEGGSTQNVLGINPFESARVNIGTYSSVGPLNQMVRSVVPQPVMMPVSFQQPAFLPASPVFNPQQKIFTRSYTPISGTPCMNVCRNRPEYNAQPKCRTACNAKPACSMLRPKVDYAVTGHTVTCRPRPLYQRNPVEATLLSADVTSYSGPAVSSQPANSDYFIPSERNDSARGSTCVGSGCGNAGGF